MLPAAAIGGTDFHARTRRDGDAKRAIARKVPELLPETGAVAFDAGTTTHEVAKLLPDGGRLQVVTASLPTPASSSSRRWSARARSRTSTCS
ncbi:hypothetical protein ACWEOE_22870 [Amycolatopsis sp. NPDC004368]